MLSKILSRLHDWRASRKSASKKFVAIIYFDGPRTKFSRSNRPWHFQEEKARGLRIPLKSAAHGYMPEPHDDETLCRREFSSYAVACGWVRGRLSGFDHEKIVGEVREL